MNSWLVTHRHFRSFLACLSVLGYDAYNNLLKDGSCNRDWKCEFSLGHQFWRKPWAPWETPVSTEASSSFICRILCPVLKMSFPGTSRWQGSQCSKLLLGFYVSLRYGAFRLQVRKRKCPTEAEGVLRHSWVSCEVLSVKWHTSWGHHSWSEHHFSAAPLPCATHRLYTNCAPVMWQTRLIQAPRLWIHSFVCETSEIINSPEQDGTAES